MSYSSTANIVLSVNGKQARQMLSQLEKDASRLRVGLAKAIAEGDKASMQKYRKELNSTVKLMDQFKGQAAKTEEVLQRLDKATPKELNTALKQLKRELNSIERGTDAWDAHTVKIKTVKAEIDRVNASLREERGIMERMKDGIGGFMKGGIGKMLALTGVSFGVKGAVDAYASMEEEMTAVRKYTGLTKQEVAALNEEFKKIDTRTGREELNKLAQQAGQLGKTSQEDILGFVKAADVINVALDELGDDAVLNIAKLNGVFGYEATYGTEKSLQKVGSVVNELSASCAASAPYITEFTSRIGGVGAQAGISMSDIMAFGAVLDSQGKNVEKSSTALQQLIIHMMQDPAKYAEAAGLQVESFVELLKTDANAALIEFLEALNRMGGLDSLAPVFADMGEKGSGMSETLATLAGNIDEVKKQQQIANQAFEEGTSVLKEFNTVNETPAAQFDKAKNHIHETVVALGAQLAPTLIKVTDAVASLAAYIPKIVDFLIKNKAAVIALVGTYTLCNAILAAATIRTKALEAAMLAKKAAIQGANIVVGAYKVSVAALNVVMSLFTGGVKGARAAMVALNTTIKANPIGLLVSALTTAIALLTTFKDETDEAAEAAKRQAEEAKRQAEERKKQYADWKKGLTDISAKSAEFCAEEITRLDLLYKKATDEAASKEERRQAALRLQEMYPDYFGNMDIELIMLGKAADAYENLKDKILEAARAKAAMELIQENTKQLLELQIKEQKLETEWEDKRKEGRKRAAEQIKLGLPNADKIMEQNTIAATTYPVRKELGVNRARQRDLKEANEQIYEISGLNPENIKQPTGFTSSGHTTATSASSGHTGHGGGGRSRNTDKFEKEKSWLKQQQILNDIAYYQNLRSKEDYEKRNLALQVEYENMRLKKCEEGTLEYAEVQAAYYKAMFKENEAGYNSSIEAEDTAYKVRLSRIKQRYIDGEITNSQYNSQIEEAEEEHLRKMVDLTEEGTKERVSAEEKLLDIQFKKEQRRKAEIEKSLKKSAEIMNKTLENLQKSQAEMKDKYFGKNASEKMKSYNEDLAVLESVYKNEIKLAGDNAEEKLRIEKAYLKALAALHEEHFGKKDPTGFKGAMQGFAEWLDSDGGKALTGSLDTVVSGMTSIFSQLTAGMQADLERQTNAIEKRYDAEIEEAEGNAYQVAKLEKKKEAEIAAIKQEAAEKQYAMQVIQAVAQTAQNALAAYGSAAAIPVVGHILAPIAAAAAVAAGMLQVSAIKKQQEAAASQGYAEGGFTKPGGKYEPVGIVHAGEWVAPQEIVNNPATRPLIEALEYARRTNTIGSIRMEDVSRTITAPAVIAARNATSPVAVKTVGTKHETKKISTAISDLSSTVATLNQRLNDPFVTVNTATGNRGINNAINKYNRLMSNKSPRKQI